MLNFQKASVVAVAFLIAACNNADNKSEEETTYTRQFEEQCDVVHACVGGLVCEEGLCRKICQTKDNCPANYDCEQSRCKKTMVVAGRCGDGVEDPGESCDDGNERSGDGCSSKCNVENNYVCKGWPSKCQCAAGFQDSNSDGFCLSDCEPCGENKVCSYNAEGSAAGCVCAQGFQDSNKDGTCLPDCTSCDASQECRYKADGSTEGCFCPEGTQDNDGDGICLPTCQSKVAKEGACPAATACYDADGTADCECTYFVKAGVSAGSGGSWDDAEATIAGAAEKAMTAIAGGVNGDVCHIWLKEGTHKIYNPIDLNNIDIYGQFKGTEQFFSERPVGGAPNTYIMSAGAGAIPHLLNVTGTVHLDGLAITNHVLDYKFTAQTDGGLITATNALLTMNNCLFDDIYTMVNNAGEYDSGVILNANSSQVTINNCTFNEIYSYNSFGGAIYSQNSQLDISGSNFVNNHNGLGGAIYATSRNAEDGLLTIKDSSFSNNVAKLTINEVVGGGAIYNEKGRLVIDNTVFAMNEVSSMTSAMGGAIWNSGPATLSRVQFYGNAIAAGPGFMNDPGHALGGAIYNKDAAMTISNAVFIGSKLSCSEYSSNTTNNYLQARGEHVYNEGDGLLSAGYIYVDVARSDAQGSAYAIKKRVDTNDERTVVYKGGKKIGDIDTKHYPNDDVYYLRTYAFDSYDESKMTITNSLICNQNLGAPAAVVDDSTFFTRSEALGNDQYSNMRCQYGSVNLDNDGYGYKYAGKSFNNNQFRTSVQFSHDDTRNTYDFAAGRQYLMISGGRLPSIILPLVNVTESAIWLPGNFGYSSLIQRNETDEGISSYYDYYMTEYTSPIITDFYQNLIISINLENVDSATYVVDKADISKGPQVATDIFGKPRKNVPDIGPFEF